MTGIRGVRNVLVVGWEGEIVEKPEGYDELMDKLTEQAIKVEYIKPEFHGLYGVNVRRISLKEMREQFPETTR